MAPFAKPANEEDERRKMIKAKMGNITTQNFKKEIWNSNLYKKLRKTVNSKEPIIKTCKDCIPMNRGKDVIAKHFDEVFYEKLRK